MVIQRPRGRDNSAKYVRLTSSRSAREVVVGEDGLTLGNGATHCLLLEALSRNRPTLLWVDLIPNPKRA